MSASRTGAPPPTARPPSVHNVKMGPLRCPRATTDEDARACMAQGRPPKPKATNPVHASPRESSPLLTRTSSRCFALSHTASSH
eukprot:871753-Pyramimonas_sp.AAC.1